MEILRFDESERSSSPRKKSSRTWLLLGFFGVVLGIGSAFASSTIAINGNNKVDLGQGVSVVTACDTAVNISAQSGTTASGTSDPTFYLKTLSVSDLNTVTKTDATSPACGGKYLDLQVYHISGSNNVPYTCYEMGYDSGELYAADGTTSLDNDVRNFACNSSTLSVYVKPGSEQHATLKFRFVDPKISTGDISNITIVSRDS